MQHTSHSVGIRRANLHDAELLAKLGATTFSQAFADANTSENMAAYLSSTFSPALQAAELQDPNKCFFLAQVNDIPVGYAKLVTSAQPDYLVANYAIELERFYIDAAWHGQGVSHTLMQQVLTHVTESGHDAVWLGVWQENKRAICFYKKWGFSVIGTKQFQLGSEVQFDFVMSRTCATAS